MAFRMPASIRYYDREGKLFSLISEPFPWQVKFSDYNNNHPPRGAGYRVLVYEKARHRLTAPKPTRVFTGDWAAY